MSGLALALLAIGGRNEKPGSPKKPHAEFEDESHEENDRAQRLTELNRRPNEFIIGSLKSNEQSPNNGGKTSNGDKMQAAEETPAQSFSQRPPTPR